MFTLTTAEKAPVLGPDDQPVLAQDVEVSTSNRDVASVSYDALDGPVYISGVAAGVARITARRVLDNATATLDVEVTLDTDPGPFSISLGTPEPK